MNQKSLVTSTVCVAAALAFALAPACGGSNSGSGFGSGGSGSGGSGSGGSGSGGSGSGSNPILTVGDGGPSIPVGDGGCVGLQCQIHSCPNSTDGTTLTGHVYDPAGNNPLYNVVVYVPNSATSPITSGIDDTSCSCDLLYTGEPIAATVTDAAGSFTLTHAPDGADIPLVVQIGKWRTQIKIPTVTLCGGASGTNDLDTLLAPYKLALPGVAGVSTASDPTKGLEQDIPNIAISTGALDTLECLLRRVGVSANEYTAGGGGTGHIHIFVGGKSVGGFGSGAPSMPGTDPASDGNLWPSNLSSYDIVLLSCEGSPTYISDVAASTTAMQAYTTSGGRLFAEHYHYEWFTDTASAFKGDNIAEWSDIETEGSGQGSGSDEYSGTVDAVIQTTLPGGASFPKGEALYTWLGNTVGALTGNVDAGTAELPILVGRHNAQVTGTSYVATPWAQTASSVTPASTQYLSFDTPVGGIKSTDGGAASYCGRVVFSDLHVSGGGGGGFGGLDQGETTGTCPTGCTDSKLQPDEDALEFMLFDLSSCVTPVTAIPQPPPTPSPPVK